jgi:hypothetical protein
MGYIKKNIDKKIMVSFYISKKNKDWLDKFVLLENTENDKGDYKISRSEILDLILSDFIKSELGKKIENGFNKLPEISDNT